MSIEQNKQLVQQYFQVFTAGGNVEVANEIMRHDFYVRGLHMSEQDIPADRRGPEEFKQAALAWRTSFPDSQMTLDEIVATEETVMVRWTFHGTHLGEFAGLQPTRRQISYSGVNGFRIVEGKLATAWDIWDRLKLWQQLNVLPETAEFLAQVRSAQAK